MRIEPGPRFSDERTRSTRNSNSGSNIASNINTNANSDNTTTNSSSNVVSQSATAFAFPAFTHRAPSPINSPMAGNVFHVKL